MIKATIGSSIVLGLSRRNLELLMEGKPISFPGSQIGVAFRNFYICFGETEEAIAQTLVNLDLAEGPD